jgi:hypothetical protein
MSHTYGVVQWGMREWGVPIRSNLQEMAHMLEVELHTRVPQEEHTVVEHPLLNLLWMLEKNNYKNSCCSFIRMKKKSVCNYHLTPIFGARIFIFHSAQTYDEHTSNKSKLPFTSRKISVVKYGLKETLSWFIILILFYLTNSITQLFNKLYNNTANTPTIFSTSLQKNCSIRSLASPCRHIQQ